jgi:hypothetical protein
MLLIVYESFMITVFARKKNETNSLAFCPQANSTVNRLPLLSHLVAEILDALQERRVVAGLANTCRYRRGQGLGDAVCTAGRGVQLNLMLTGESGLNFVGLPAGSYVAGEVVRQLAVALLFRKGEAVLQPGTQRGVGNFFMAER